MDFPSFFAGEMKEFIVSLPKFNGFSTSLTVAVRLQNSTLVKMDVCFVFFRALKITCFAVEVAHA